MSRSLFFILFFVFATTGFAKSAQQPQVTHIQPDINNGPNIPYEDRGHIQEKMQTVGDLVAQEEFLKQLGYNGDWPTPDEVDKKVEEIEKAQKDKPVKIRGLANIPLAEMAKQYRRVNEVWGDYDPVDRRPTEEKAMTSAELYHGTRFQPSNVAPVKGSSSGESRRFKSQ